MTNEDAKQFVYVGLGNPGKEYEKTRHNIGNLVLRSFAHNQGFVFKADARFKAEIAKGEISGVKIHCLFPTTYMNESGVAVRKYIDFFKINSNRVVVISDDVDLPFGQMRLKTSGGAGTHNGLKSIEKYLATQCYPRLRMGIGLGYKDQDLADHVLSRFSAEEAATLDSFIKQGASVLARLIIEDIALVMNDINKKQKTDFLLEEGQEKNNDSRKF